MHGEINSRSVYLSFTDETDPKVVLLDAELYCLENKETDDRNMENIAFQAPEMFTNIYDAQADVWSCGVLMHLLLTGTLPFYGPTIKETTYLIMNQTLTFDIEKCSQWANISDYSKHLLQTSLDKS
jgi:serine/threonine protein kinase